jgi:hypothetical protein
MLDDIRQYANTALWNAHYHFTKLKEATEAPGNATPWRHETSLTAEQRERLQMDVNLYAVYLRACFWELISVFDMLERWAKAEVRKKQRRPADCAATVLAALSNAQNQSWYQSLSAYRNFSHQGMLPRWTLFSGTKKAVTAHLLPSVPGQPQQDVIDHLSQCGEEMKKLVNLALSCS